MHVDQGGLFNAAQIYRMANITGELIERVITGLWKSLNDLYTRATGERFPDQPEYDGTDIVKLNEFYAEGFER